MCDIERCVELVQLYLYSNQINSIEGLDKLVRLEKLWLNGNHITRVEGLQNLHNLRDLNLAANCVASLGDEINELQKLEILDISGNHLSSFEVSLTNILLYSGTPLIRTLLGQKKVS